MEHHRYGPCSGIETLSSTGVTVDANFLGQFIDALVIHVREQVRADSARTGERFGIASGSQPEGKLRLERRGIGFQRYSLAIAAFDLNRFATPEFTHLLDAGVHHLAALLVVLRRKREVVGVPAGGKGEPDTTTRKVIDHRPFFRDTQWVVQWNDYAACTQRNTACLACQCRL